MAELKTRPTKASVASFLDAIEDESRRRDCKAVLRMMKRVTRARPTMWGSSIVGFGVYKYRYATGHSAEWPVSAFSPRKNDLTLYIMPAFPGREALLAKLGKHKTAKSCLYLKRLSDVDPVVLEQLVSASVEHMKRSYETSFA